MAEFRNNMIHKDTGGVGVEIGCCLMLVLGMAGIIALLVNVVRLIVNYVK